MKRNCFHSTERKEREERGQVSSKSAAVSFSRFNPLDCLFITRATSYRDPPPLCAPPHDGWNTGFATRVASFVTRFQLSVRKWSVYSLISPVTNHVNRWERTSFVWRCSFTRIPTTMLDGERGRERKSIENNPRGD